MKSPAGAGAQEPGDSDIAVVTVVIVIIAVLCCAVALPTTLFQLSFRL